VILAFVFPLSWLAGVILFVTAPLIPLFMALIGMGAAQQNRRHFKALSRMSVAFLDVLQGLPTLKWFGASKPMRQKLFKVSDQYRQTTMSVLRIVFLSSAVLEFFSAIAIALLATILGLTFLHHIHIGYYGHRLTLHAALFMLILAPEFYLPLRELNTHYHARAEAIAASEQIMEVLCSDVNTNIIPVKAGIQGIEIKNLSVQFPESKIPSLHDINLKIKIGTKLAIVGPSGAGKSTLLNVLMGFVNPSAGTVHCDRQHITWLGQQPKLFHGSIRENLLMAKPDASDDELWAALAQAKANDFVAQLPAQLDTLLAEHNAGISGGQAQRIAAARMMLKSASIVLLDEPTANLDQANADELMRAILAFAKGKTLLLVTHQKQYADQCDVVLNLDQGRIAKQPVYAKEKADA